LQWDVKIISLQGNYLSKQCPLYIPYNRFLWTGQKKATVAGGFKNWQLINFLATVFSLDVNGNTNTH